MARLNMQSRRKLREKHISRRDFELYTQAAVLEPLQAQALFRSLYQGITESNVEDALILLCMLTGQDIEDFIDIETLKRDGKLLNDTDKNTVYLKRVIGVPDANKKADPQHLEKSSKEFLMPLPVEVVNLVRSRSPENTLSKQRVKSIISDRLTEHKNNSGIALLSTGRCESTLHTLIRRKFGDQVIADFICNRSIKHSPALNYICYPLDDVLKTYKKAIEFLSEGTSFSLKYLNLAIEEAAGKKCGSQNVVKLDSAKKYFGTLLNTVNTEKNRALKHNAITLWLWNVISLLTTSRAVQHIPGYREQIDLDSKYIWIADKENRNVSAGRFVPICYFLEKTFQAYFQYLKTLKNEWALKDPELANILDEIENNEYPLLFFKTQEKWEAAIVAHTLQPIEGLPSFPSNWTRQLTRTFLAGRHSDCIINAIFSHEKLDQEVLNTYSSVPLFELRAVTNSYDELVRTLNLSLPDKW